LRAHARAPVALHDEELAHPEFVLGQADIRVHQAEAGVIAIDQEEIGAKPRVAKVAIDRKAVLAMLAQRLRPDLGQVVLVQLEQA